jgi:hypothetical protein
MPFYWAAAVALNVTLAVAVKEELVAGAISTTPGGGLV